MLVRTPAMSGPLRGPDIAGVRALGYLCAQNQARMSRAYLQTQIAPPRVRRYRVASLTLTDVHQFVAPSM